MSPIAIFAASAALTGTSFRLFRDIVWKLVLWQRSKEYDVENTNVEMESPRWCESPFLLLYILVDSLLGKGQKIKTSVLEREIDTRLLPLSMLVGDGTNPGMGDLIPYSACMITVATTHGDLTFEVPRELFNQLKSGDDVFVSYRIGRWSREARGGKIVAR